jgi:SAM-dependent methyltransferase
MHTFTQRRLRFMWRYLRGDVPWDSGIVPPEIRAWVEAMESDLIPPTRALDLGCGTGTTSIYLAAHGWSVVGVDFAPNAIWQAQRKARREARRGTLMGSAIFHGADVSRLDFLPGDPPFDLLVDVGCLHGLDSEQRTRYAAHLTRLSRPGTEYLLYAFYPRRRGSGMVGIDPDGVRVLFPAFELIDHVVGEEVTKPVASAWSTLRRKDTTP